MDAVEVAHEGDARHAEVGLDANVEAAVAVHPARIVAVLDQVFLFDDEHGNARAVLGLVEDLSRLELGRVEIGQLDLNRSTSTHKSHKHMHS